MHNYIQEKKARAKDDGIFLVSALENIEQVVMSGGKRLRGALLYHGYKAGGGTDEDIALMAAAGIEFIHSYILVHDDIMDRDDLRHGVSTLHKRYEVFANKHFENKNDVHFGMSLGIILGDMLCAWGNDCIFGVDLPREQVQKALQKMQEVVYRTGVGQMKDMYMEFSGSADAEDILAMYADKTAHYTIEGPLQIGLFLGGDTGEKEKIFAEYAHPIGIAFQLQDDFLGLYGDEEKTGKRSGADIVEGKLTFLMQQTLALATPPEKEKLKKILASGDAVTEEDITWVRGICEQSGARKVAEELITSSLAKGRKVLVDSGTILPSQTQEFLLQFTDYLENRTY